MLLIVAVLGSIYAGIATATEAAAFGVVGSLLISLAQRSLTWTTFHDSLMGATRLYCMIALILAGAVVPDAGDGLHRAAAPSRRMDLAASACRRSG